MADAPTPDLDARTQVELDGLVSHRYHYAPHRVYAYSHASVFALVRDLLSRAEHAEADLTAQVDTLWRSLQTVRTLYEDEKEHVDRLIRSNRALTDILHDTKTALQADLIALRAERDQLTEQKIEAENLAIEVSEWQTYLVRVLEKAMVIPKGTGSTLPLAVARVIEKLDRLQEAEAELIALRRAKDAAEGRLTWQPIETAPKEGAFLVCGAFAGGMLLKTMVADGKMLSLSRLSNTPKHLSGAHWTHWMPLPDQPLASAAPTTEPGR